MNEQLKILCEFMKDYGDTVPDEIDGNMQLISDLGFNSLTLIELVNDAETRFSVTFDDDELVGIVTVGNLLKLLNEKNAAF